MAFSASVTEQAFVLKHIVGIEALSQHERFADATPDMVQAIVEGIGAFAEGEFAPLNRIGDTVGARLKDGKVVMPEGFVAAYKAYVANGWGSINAPSAFGGQGLPFSMATVALDSLGAANMAFALCPILWVRPAKAVVPAQTVDWRMVRHDEPDRATGRFRCRRAEINRDAARRWHLPNQRHQNIYQLW
jgi:hypothetical protein